MKTKTRTTKTPRKQRRQQHADILKTLQYGVDLVESKTKKIKGITVRPFKENSAQPSKGRYGFVLQEMPANWCFYVRPTRVQAIRTAANRVGIEIKTHRYKRGFVAIQKVGT